SNKRAQWARATISETTTACDLPSTDFLQPPLGALAEEAAGVVVEDVGGLCLGVSAAEEFQARVGEIGGTGFAPVAGAVDANHVGAELLEDVGSTLRRDFGDRVDREAGPEAVVAGQADRVLLAVVD